MIHTVYSNSYEVLRTVLLHNLKEPAEARPGEAFFAQVFEDTPVIVPSLGVAVDLKRALARESGVCAGVDLLRLSAWMGFYSKEPLANVVGNEADWMIWRILREKGPGSFRSRPECRRLAANLEGKTSSEIFALSRRIAALFVSYATYRLDWVFEWLGMHEAETARLIETEPVRRERRELEKNPDWLWQRALWQELALNPSWQGRRFLESFPSTLRMMESVASGLRRIRLEDGRTVEMPESLHLFVPFVVPPLMLPLLKAYAASGRDVWLYLLNPSCEYWFDLVPRRFFRERAKDDHREVGHTLLADNGWSTRANIDRLWRFTSGEDTGAEATSRYDRKDYRSFADAYFGRAQDLKVDVDVDVQSYYIEANEPALLRRIQDSILDLDEGRVMETAPQGELLEETDESVLFIEAPTSMRELEGIVDLLHHAFESDPDLTPSDVLVVTPDVSASLALIEQVFGSLPEGRRIPWRITGTCPIDTDSPGATILALGRLLARRVRIEPLLEWLSLPLVARRFGLTVEDLGILEAWLKAAGFRFGLSDAHLALYDAETFAEVREMNLERALERLVMGFFLPDDDRAPRAEVLPVRGCEIEGWTGVDERPGLLTTLAMVASELERLRLRAAEPGGLTAREWAEWCMDAVESLLPKEGIEFDYRALRSTVNALADEADLAAQDAPEAMKFDFELFLTALEGRLETAAGAGEPTNAVTFTGMHSLRGLPFKIIIIFGLGEECAFPGTSRREEYDLMAGVPRRGDRDARVDNRNAFLDLLLAARKRFVVSYPAGTAEAPRRASIVAEELRSWILSLAPDRAMRERTAARLTRRLPLNAYSAGNFDARGAWRSTDAVLLAALERAEAEAYLAPEARFADTGLDLGIGPNGVLPLSAVTAWWRHPSGWVLKQEGIRLPDLSERPELELAPASDGLSAWKRRDEALRALLSGESVDALAHRWSVDGRFGTKGVREWAVRTELESSAALAERVKEAESVLRPVEERRLEVALRSGLRVVFTLGGLAADADGRLTALRYSVSASDGSPLRGLFIEYAAARAAGVELVWRVLVTPKATEKKPRREVVFPEIDKARAIALLERFAAPVVALERGSARQCEGSADSPEDRFLWRGAPLAQAALWRERLTKAITAMACAETFEAFERAVSAFDEAARGAEELAEQNNVEESAND